jgi:hypothetical protein
MDDTRRPIRQPCPVVSVLPKFLLRKTIPDLPDQSDQSDQSDLSDLSDLSDR